MCEVEGFCACRGCLYGSFLFFVFFFWYVCTVLDDRIGLQSLSTLSMFRDLKCAAKDVASHARSC